MKSLNKNWLLEGHIDFEYKKYLLLDYLSHVDRDFDQMYLYPHLSNLIDHYKALKHLKSSHEGFGDSFGRELEAIDFQKLKLEYKAFQDHPVIQEIIEIVDFSLPRIKHSIDNGVKKYNHLEEAMSIEIVGMEPLYKKEGLLILGSTSYNRLLTFYYKLLGNAQSAGKWLGIQLRFIRSYMINLRTSLSEVKLDLKERFVQLPVPATYYIEFRTDLPIKGAMIPIAKRTLLGSVK